MDDLVVEVRENKGIYYKVCLAVLIVRLKGEQSAHAVWSCSARM